MKFSNFVMNLLVLSSLIGCVATMPSKTVKIDKKAEKAIKQSFTIIARGMSEGDLETVYQYLSRLQHNQQSHDEFVADYERNKSVWQIMFCDAYLKYIAIEENKASVGIIWGTGGNALGEFIKEKKVWKLNFISGTTSIIPPRSVEQ